MKRFQKRHKARRILQKARTAAYQRWLGEQLLDALTSYVGLVLAPVMEAEMIMQARAALARALSES